MRCTVVTTALVVAGCGFQHGGIADRDGATGDGSGGGDGSMIDAPWPDPILIQQGVAYAASTQSPLLLTLPSRPAIGHVLVMVGAAEHAPLTTVTGGGVATWTRATSSSKNMNIEIWYGTSDGTSDTVTTTSPSFMLPTWMHVGEWANLSTIATLDQAKSGFGSGGLAGTGTLNTGHARDLLVFGVTDMPPNTFGTPTPDSWTALTPVEQVDVVQGAWYEVVSAAGSYAPTVTQTGNSWDSSLAAFEIGP